MNVQADLGVAQVNTVLSQPDPSLTPEELVARAVAMRPLLRAQQVEADALGCPTPEAHQAFVDAGFYRVVQPKMFGGYEFDAGTFLKLIIEISRGHPGAGWCLALSATRPMVVASIFPEEVQREFFGSSGHLVAPYRAPPAGTFTREDGGWRVSGRWAFSSGSPYATHFMGGCLLPTEPAPTPACFVVPIDQVRRLDDWGGDVSLGVKASGSNTILIEDLFVPDRYFGSSNVFVGPEDPAGSYGTILHGNPMYHGAMVGLYGVDFLGICVGAAYAALDEYEELMRTKPVQNVLPPRSRLHDADALRSMGRAILLTECAERIGQSVCDEFMELGERWGRTGQQISEAESMRMYAMALQGADMAAEAVDLLFTAASPIGAVRNHPLSRYIRDVLMYRVHPATQPWKYACRAEAYLDIPIGFFGYHHNAGGG